MAATRCRLAPSASLAGRSPALALPISVVIPALNAESTIARALRSVMIQEPAPQEIVVIDDASTDGTAALAAGLIGPTGRIITQPKRAGAAQARNIGIDAANGEWIAFLDADDEWLPGKLRKQMDVVAADVSVDMVACGAIEIAVDGTNLGPLYDGRIPQAGDLAWQGLLARNTIATPTVLARRDTLRRVGGFDPALRIGEDQDMWLKLTMGGRLGYVDEVLVIVHAAADSLSSRGYADDLAYTYPMLLRHLGAKREALTAREVNRILAARLAHLGRAAYTQRHWRDGFLKLTEASLRGETPFANLSFMMRASPPMRWIKRVCGRAR